MENGGTFSMNYNDYGGGEFLNGASINGKLILKDESTLENAKIYSNTNNIANGSEARRNTDPVVVINGNVKLKGKVVPERRRGSDRDRSCDRKELHRSVRSSGQRHFDT